MSSVTQDASTIKVNIQSLSQPFSETLSPTQEGTVSPTPAFSPFQNNLSPNTKSDMYGHQLRYKFRTNLRSKILKTQSTREIPFYNNECNDTLRENILDFKAAGPVKSVNFEELQLKKNLSVTEEHLIHMERNELHKLRKEEISIFDGKCGLTILRWITFLVLFSPIWVTATTIYFVTQQYTVVDAAYVQDYDKGNQDGPRPPSSEMPEDQRRGFPYCVVYVLGGWVGMIILFVVMETFSWQQNFYGARKTLNKNTKNGGCPDMRVVFWQCCGSARSLYRGPGEERFYNWGNLLTYYSVTWKQYLTTWTFKALFSWYWNFVLNMINYSVFGKNDPTVPYKVQLAEIVLNTALMLGIKELNDEEETCVFELKDIYLMVDQVDGSLCDMVPNAEANRVHHEYLRYYIDMNARVCTKMELKTKDMDEVVYLFVDSDLTEEEVERASLFGLHLALFAVSTYFHPIIHCYANYWTKFMTSCETTTFYQNMTLVTNANGPQSVYPFRVLFQTISRNVMSGVVRQTYTTKSPEDPDYVVIPSKKSQDAQPQDSDKEPQGKNYYLGWTTPTLTAVTSMESPRGEHGMQILSPNVNYLSPDLDCSSDGYNTMSPRRDLVMAVGQAMDRDFTNDKQYRLGPGGESTAEEEFHTQPWATSDEENMQQKSYHPETESKCPFRRSKLWGTSSCPLGYTPSTKKLMETTNNTHSMMRNISVLGPEGFRELRSLKRPYAKTASTDTTTSEDQLLFHPKGQLEILERLRKYSALCDFWMTVHEPVNTYIMKLNEMIQTPTREKIREFHPDKDDAWVDKMRKTMIKYSGWDMEPVSFWCGAILHSTDHFFATHVTEMNGLEKYDTPYMRSAKQLRMLFIPPHRPHVMNQKIKDSPLLWMQHIYTLLKEGTQKVRGNPFSKCEKFRDVDFHDVIDCCISS